MDLYNWLLYLHILSAITWMGAGITIVLLGFHSRKTKTELKVIDQMEWIGPRVGGPSVFITLITGIGLVHDYPGWSFGNFWVIAGLVFLALLFSIGIMFHVPQYKKIRKAVKESGEDSPAVRKLISQSFNGARLEVVLLILVVWMMVLKPGMGEAI